MEYVRHLVISAELFYGVKRQMEEKEYKGYPSDSFYDQIRVSISDLEMIIGCSQDDALLSLLDLKREFETYSLDVYEAQAHMKDPAIPLNIKESDFSIIRSDIWDLVNSVLSTVSEIYDNCAYEKALLLNTLSIRSTNDMFSSFTDGAPYEYEHKEYLNNTVLGEWLDDEELDSFYKEFNHRADISDGSVFIFENPS